MWPASCRSTNCRSRSTNTTRSSSRARSSQYKSGYLSYAIVVGWYQLAKDFAYWRASSIGAKTAVEASDRAWFDADRKRRELLLLRDLGYWSHFPGDASMPLHTSEHFYGWGPYPNPNGYATGDAMELYVKGTFVRRNINRDVVKAGVPPYDACNCTIWDRARKLILASNKQVVQMYELDKKGAFKAAAPEAIALVSAELSLGAAAVRDMVIDAWKDELGHGSGRSGRQHARHPVGQAHPAPRRLPLRLIGDGA